MEYLGFWVTWNGIRPIKKCYGQNETTEEQTLGACVKRIIKLL